MTIYQKLTQVQNELKAPKSQYNSFGKYSYRSQEDILEAVKPLLLKNNLALFIKDEVILIGERYYIKAICTIVDTENGATIENTALARESHDKKGMDDSQISGTASSYARKYALNGLFLIDDTKDSDSEEYNKTQQQKETTQTGQAPNKASEKQLKLVNTLLERVAKAKNTEKQKVIELFKIKTIEGLSSKNANIMITNLNKMLENNQQDV